MAQFDKSSYTLLLMSTRYEAQAEKSSLRNLYDLSLPELTELLAEAGFSKTTVWWEGTAKDGRGNGEFSPETKGEADAGWVA